MNRKNLTAAVLAGLAGVVGIAGSAQAVNINPDGTGQVLLYPYYTTNAGNMTLLSVVNTSEDAKAVKVRFMESENSQEVLDFNLYMSAYDVWTAAIAPIPAGVEYDDCDPILGDDDVVFCAGPHLIIKDDETTCTVPYLNGAQPFLPYQYSDDEGSQTQSRMNEGHMEMIEMGTLDAEMWPAKGATHDHDTDGTGMPADCDALNEAWTDTNDQIDGGPDGGEGAWLLDPTEGVDAPSGGLFGGAAIVNVQAGAMHTYDATALNGWNMSGFEGEFLPSIHAEPGTVKPSLGSGDQTYGYAFSESGSTLNSGDLDSTIDAVSYVLMHDTLMNEYTTEMAVAGQTEWVVTFPTKRFYVNDVKAPIRPFTTLWDPIDEGDLATACETVELKTLWDREERIEPDKTCEDTDSCPIVDPPVVSPPRPGTDNPPPPGRVPFELCYETNVIRFGAAGDEGADLPGATEILGSPMPNYRNIDNEILGFQYGWARIELDDYLESVGNDDDGYVDVERTRTPIGENRGQELNGLPVIGFAVQRFSNGFLGVDANVLSSYGGLFTHKTSRKQGSDVQ